MIAAGELLSHARGKARIGDTGCDSSYLVEVFFHHLKRFRAIGTRHEKTACNYLALVHVACARLWLENE